MELKENTKRNGKTNRKNPFKHRAFHEIISWDQQYSIPQDIQWEIEQRLDSGIFKLSQHFDTVVMVTFQGNSFKKLPPHVLTNKSTFSHAGNEHMGNMNPHHQSLEVWSLEVPGRPRRRKWRCQRKIWTVR